MVLDVTFYQSANWNISSPPDTNTVGGAATSTPVGATLSDVFPEGVSDYIGQDARVRYQKIWVENTSGDPISNVKMFLNNVKHPGQIQIALGSGNDLIANPTISPILTFLEPIGLANAVTVIASLGSGISFSIWIKQSILANLPSEVGASTTIGIIGEV
jgi:hypothetical protein